MQVLLLVDVCTAVGQTNGQTNGHPTVIIRHCNVGRTSAGRLSAEVGCIAIGQTDGQTEGHLTVIIRACDGGRTGDGRLHSCGTNRRTDKRTLDRCYKSM